MTDRTSPDDHRDRGDRPITIAVLAMGGEGGGVLADWLVSLAEANGHIAQTTSVPGVAPSAGTTSASRPSRSHQSQPPVGQRRPRCSVTAL